IYIRLLGQFFKNLILFHLGQILYLRPKAEDSTANIAKDMGSLFGLALDQIFFTIDRSLKLMGVLLQLFLCTDFFGQQIVFGFLVWHNYSFLSSNRHKKYRLLVQTVYREDSRIKRRKREPLLYGMKFRKTSGLSSTEVSLAERTIPPFRSGIEVRP